MSVFFCCGLLCPSGAPAQAYPLEPGAGAESLGPALVAPPAQALVGDRQAQVVEEALRSSPEAVAARAASRTAYENLSGGQARQVLGDAFPSMVDEPSGGPPKLPSGEQVVGYPTENAVQVALPEGKRGLIESSAPMAVETSPGQRLPVDLALSESGRSLVLTRPLVALGIPKRLQEGVSLLDSGVSLTPLNASDAPVGGSEGSVDGAVAFYGGVEMGADVDVVVKPLTGGFAEDALLRSARSPQQLAFRVGLPEGATLRQDAAGSGAVEVVSEGQARALVLPPAAQDATGAAVPVAMSVSGDTLTLSVDDGTGEYEFPIRVDPTIVDKQKTRPYSWQATNWQFTRTAPGLCESEGSGKLEGEVWSGELAVVRCTGGVERGQYGDLLYTTQGASKIDSFKAETFVVDPEEQMNTYMALANSSYEAGPVQLPVGEGWHEVSVASPSSGNTALFEVIPLKEGLGWAHSGMYHTEVTLTQEAGPQVSLNTGSEAITMSEEQYENALYGGRWASATAGKWTVAANATDPGVGVQHVTWSSPNAPKWGLTREASCKSVQCPESWAPDEGISWGEHLPDGEDTVEAKVEDAFGLTASTGPAKVKVDNTAPSIILTGLPSGNEISDGQQVTVKASATDGKAPTPSSGVASIVLKMDGQQVGAPAKGCSPGECTASGEWTLSAESYGAGKHTLTVLATDNVGNVGEQSYTVTVHHAAGLTVGPGSVNPVTGELSVNASDVSIAVPAGALTVARSYRSRHLAQGAEGPLGSQWALSLGAQESLTETADGHGMVLTANDGSQAVFVSAGGESFTSPQGDAGMTLTGSMKSGVFTLKENGSVTQFARPVGGNGSVAMPSATWGSSGTNATTFAYKQEGGVIKPTQELAPVPVGVSCTPTLAKGCRALGFVYGTETKAGEAPGEWGEYTGRLKEVTYTAYDPASKEMKTVTVSAYAWDKQGRLRTQWNPRVEPALDAVYGYDSEGHVTAVAAPGQEPWLVEQGTTPGDAGPGRVLAVVRPPAGTTTELKAQMGAATPVNTSAPVLSSTTPTVGVKISVANSGSWSNGPLAYSYQWRDCNSSGKECVAIPGALNQAYYPVKSDEGRTLMAEVVALNAAGAKSATSAATSVVASGTQNTPLPEPPAVGKNAVFTIEYGVALSGTGLPTMTSTEVAKWGQADLPAEATAVFPPDSPEGWPAKEYARATIVYLDKQDRAVNVSSPTGGISTSEYNAYNDITRTLSPDNRAAALAAGERSKELAKELDSESTYNESGSEPGTELLSTLGPKHTVQLANGTQTEARAHTVYSYNEGAPIEGGPYHLVTKTTEGAQIAGKEEADVRTTATSYSGQNNLGWKLHKPTSLTIDPAGLKLTHSTFYEPKAGGVTETRMPAAGAPGEEQGYFFQSQFGESGTKGGQFKEPQDVVVNSGGRVYVLDAANARIEEFNSKGKFVRSFGELGEGAQLKEPHGLALDSKGDVWTANTGEGTVKEFDPSGSVIATIFTGKPTGVAVGSNGDLWIVKGGENSGFAEYEYSASIKEWYSVRSYFGKPGSGETQFSEPKGIALGGENNVYISDTGNNRIDEYNVGEAQTKHVRNFAKEGTGAGQVKAPRGIATDSAGDVWVADTGNNRIEEFNSTGVYLGTFGKEGTGEGKLKGPQGVAIDGESNAWVADTANNNVHEWTPNGTGYGSGTASAHDTQTIYYTAGANSKVAVCGEHPEWANLPCLTQPAVQPEGSLPKLQVTTFTYNMWDEPEVTTNTSGTTTRTTTQSYDSVGRPTSTAISSTVGTALPTVTIGYSRETGALEQQSTTNEGKTRTITSVENTLGELSSYTDGDENTSTYEYDIDGRIKKINNGRGTETYTYSKATGLPTELVNEYGATKLTFTASLDVEGNILTEGYPNGMNANYTYNTAGKPTSLEYKKTTHCSEKCTWLSDTVVPSIHGQWLSQTSTLSKQAYSDDAAGRLTQVQSTPTGKGCTTRVYAYDADTNRTILTTREPNAKGECASEGGTEEKHTYDSADRLTDAGTGYNPFGDTTALPSNDAGGKEPAEELTSSYYVDNQLQSETQSGETIGYNLDPAGRTRETVATGKKVSDVINHYAGPGSAPAWTTNTSGETSRNIVGMTGQLVASQSNTEAPVLQLSNLHGDIVATAYLSETATELASKADTSEYGVPAVSAPPKYGWLGAIQLPTELPSGVVAMGARSYVPQLGRFLQDDPVPGGSANAYSYTFGDPVNTSDPTGASTIGELIAGHAHQVGAEAQAKEEAEIAARRAAEEAAARAIAERAAQEAAWNAQAAAGPQYTGGEEGVEEWEEWWEEEGGYEYVSDRYGAESGDHEAHIESGVLYQPLGGEAGGESTVHLGSTMPLCEAVVEGPCARLVPDNHSPNIQSQCNRTGQHCSGHRGSGRRPSGGGAGDVCHASPFAALAGAAFGPVGFVVGMAVTVACNGR